jgi:hypothetical protein
MSQIYKCVQCNAIFDSKKKLDAHEIFSHKIDTSSKKKILILGGVHVIKELQKK